MPSPPAPFVPVARCSRAAGIVVALSLAALACTRQVSVTYLPSVEQPRLSLTDAREMLERYATVECPRLMGDGRGAGAVRVRVAVAANGDATSAELDGSTGDSRIDGVIGAVTAQLQLAPSGEQGAPRTTLRAGYRCAADGGVAAVLEPL